MNFGVVFTAHLDLNPLIQGWEILSWSVDANGEEIDLLLIEDAERIQSLRYSLGIPTGYSARRLHASEHYHWNLNLTGLTRAYAYLCGLTEERFVMLNHKGSEQFNATLFDGAGKELSRFWIGDYVEQLQADRAGNLWVSYCDQGYCKTYSERGLSCYDNQGQAVAPWWNCPMMDCYAMNASKDGVWLCGYEKFAIVHVGLDRCQREWSNQVRGAIAMVGWGQKVALYGGYEERAQHLTTLRLTSEGQAVVEGESIARLPVDSERTEVIGRGPYFHALGRGVWYRLDPRPLLR